MKQVITESEFIREFEAHNRGDDFSHAALVALFGYLEQFESDTGEEIELDVIGLCCEFCEYDLDELRDNYGYLFDKDFDEYDDWLILDWAEKLSDHTQVIEVDNDSVVLVAF